MRYGENPHQEGHWYHISKKGLHEAQILQGKKLSYNNILDLEASIQVVRNFKEKAGVVVKHNSPCGVALAEDVKSLTPKLLEADPESSFGGIVAFNCEVDEEMAKNLTSSFSGSHHCS